MAAGHAAALPEMPPMGDMAATVPLQSLLDKTTERLLATTEVSDVLEHGATYEFVLKSGNDGQSGRGSYNHKPCGATGPRAACRTAWRAVSSSPASSSPASSSPARSSPAWRAASRTSRAPSWTLSG